MFLDWLFYFIGKFIFFTGSILTGSTFPKPLSKDEEEEYYEDSEADEGYVELVNARELPDGTVKEVETGSTGGEKIEITSPTTDEASMKARGEQEVKRRTFDGYDGSITTWLVPECQPGDSANLHDGDYPDKDGCYFVRSVTTEFSSSGGKRKIGLGFRLR